MPPTLSRTAVAAILTVLTSIAFTSAAEPPPIRDGKRFDPGAAMSQRAEGAPEQLDALRYLLGNWDVTWKHAPAPGAGAGTGTGTGAGDKGGTTAQGRAEITYMNRGHAYLERAHSPDFDGQSHELHSLALLAVGPGGKLWSRGQGDSYSRAIRVFSGPLEGERLVLLDAERRLGTGPLVLTRLTFQPAGEDAFTMTREVSRDHGESWRQTLEKSYRRSQRPLPPGKGYGRPAPSEPPEARQFDFLIGTFDAPQDLTFPNGQNVKFPSTTTAVHALGGHGILEFGWFDVDPSLPDAATTILRLYNPAMRRWESLYLANRGNAMLHFGGRQEGDRIVLHQFAADLADPSFGHFVFHSIGKDGYKWYAETTNDHGKTFKKTWIIEMARKKEPSGDGG